MQQTKNNFERSIEFTPAYDNRRKEGGERHCMNLCFVLKRQKNAVQFLLFSGWESIAVQKEREGDIFNGMVMPADLGYHSSKPQYKNHKPLSKKCEYINNKPCYYDGSTLNAEEPYNILVKKGEEALWKFLEKYFSETFN